MRPAAEAAVWDIEPDTARADNRRFRHRIFSALPDGHALNMARVYRRLWEESRVIGHANEFLLDTAAKLKRNKRKLAASDYELIECAEKRARLCRLIRARIKDDASAHDACVRFAESEGIRPPAVGVRGVTIAGAIARLGCSKWWRRAIRRTHGRDVEGAALTLGMVHKHADIYASEPTVERRHQQRTRNRKILESILAVNELGQQYTLQELAELSVSNPVIRRGELMTRLAGFEQIANALGHDGYFVTITCPSRMHARDYETGEEHRNYDGTTPKQAHQYLGKQWEKMRAAIQRGGWQVYGFRIAEPHHDATPHWHMMLFMEPDAYRYVIGRMWHYALEVDGTEKGAAKHRFNVKKMDKAKGTATGYLAKYIAKNIDGFGVDYDLFGKDAKKGAQSVDAWASTWGIRQFQQIGGPSVSVWRELRRLSGGPQNGESIERARFVADLGDWAGYVQSQGGPILPREARPVQLAKTHSDKPNSYGEPIGERIIGVSAGAVVVVSRVHEWSIQRGKKNVQGDLEVSVSAVGEGRNQNRCDYGNGARGGEDGAGDSENSFCVSADVGDSVRAGIPCADAAPSTREETVTSSEAAPALNRPGGSVADLSGPTRARGAVVAVPRSPVNNCTRLEVGKPEPPPGHAAKSIGESKSEENH
jgi:hypothetical protein